MTSDLLTDAPSTMQMDSWLRSGAAEVECGGPGRWRLAAAGCSQPIAVQADGRWLRLMAGLTSGGPAALDSLDTRRLLGTNAALPPPLKYTLDDAGTPWSVFDLACDDEADVVQAALPQAVSAIFDALEVWNRFDPRPVGLSASAGRATTWLDSGSQLADLCQTAGWPAELRSAGQLVVPLEVGGDFYQARATQDADGVVRLETEFEPCATSSATCAAAIERLLLEASHALRLVRATVATVDAMARYRWEAAWQGLPSSRQLNHALSALSVACQLTARESAALADPRVAARYLELRGLRRMQQ